MLMAKRKRIGTIELDRFRAQIVRREQTILGHSVEFSLSKPEKNLGGGWRKLRYGVVCRTTPFTPSSKEEAIEKAKRIDRKMKRKVNAIRQKAAVNKRERQKREEKIEAAREEFQEWVDSLPFASADAYKEDPDRWQYHGYDPSRRTNRGRTASRKSMNQWALEKARQKCPERVAEKAEEIREKHDLHSGIGL